MDDIEKQIGALLDNIVEATSRTVVARYEARINELEQSYQSLTDEQLRAKTDEFRARVSAGSSDSASTSTR